MAQKIFIGHVLKGGQYEGVTGLCRSLEDAIRAVESHFRDPRAGVADARWREAELDVQVYRGDDDGWRPTLVEFSPKDAGPMACLAIYKVIEGVVGGLDPAGDAEA